MAKMTIEQVRAHAAKNNLPLPPGLETPSKAPIPTRPEPPAGPGMAGRKIPAQDSGPAAPAKPRSKWLFTIPGAPMGKPRMTRRDKWKKRPAVVKYRNWADRARAAAPSDLPAEPISVSWVAYLPLPKSWRKPLQDAMRWQLHRHKPDRDNIDKALLDALFKNDAGVCQGTLEKRWDDGSGPRLEVTVESVPTHG